MPSKVKGGSVDKHLADTRFPRVSMIDAATGGAAAFVPTSIAGLLLWLKADVGLTLDTSSYAGAGTITQVTTTVTGIGTAFLHAVKVGDLITATGISGNVVSIASNTSLTLNTSATQAVGQAYTIAPVAGATDRVSTWADQSGNGRDFTQATQADRPVKHPNIQNSLPVVQFWGGDFLSHAGIVIATTHTFFCVNTHRFNTGAGYGALFTPASSVGYYRKSTLFNYYYSGDHNNSTVMTDNTFYLMESTVSSGNITLYRNAAADGTYASAVGFTAAKIGQDTTNNFGGDIAEMGIYDSALSDGNRQALEAYLNTKWAIY